ncbi:MAG: SPOR domain-containing protein [Novosphingobium sp.]
MMADENRNEGHEGHAEHGGQDGAQEQPFVQSDAPESGAARLDLDEEERLPWLESIDDEDYDSADSGRLVMFLVAGLAVLAALVGGIWWASHRAGRAELQADGSVIEAPKAPYKEAPKDPGGKTFAGTGDTSYQVSEGKSTPPKLDQSGQVIAPATDPAKPSAPAAPAPSGVGVQVGAYTSLATAEAGWASLSQRHAAVLSGVKHRVIEGKADIGTVYRLQAVAGDVAGANDLCTRLKAAGVACQVKN